MIRTRSFVFLRDRDREPECRSNFDAVRGLQLQRRGPFAPQKSHGFHPFPVPDQVASGLLPFGMREG